MSFIVIYCIGILVSFLYYSGRTQIIADIINGENDNELGKIKAEEIDKVLLIATIFWPALIICEVDGFLRKTIDKQTE